MHAYEPFHASWLPQWLQWVASHGMVFLKGISKINNHHEHLFSSSHATLLLGVWNWLHNGHRLWAAHPHQQANWRVHKDMCSWIMRWRWYESYKTVTIIPTSWKVSKRLYVPLSFPFATDLSHHAQCHQQLLVWFFFLLVSLVESELQRIGGWPQNLDVQNLQRGHLLKCQSQVVFRAVSLTSSSLNSWSR